MPELIGEAMLKKARSGTGFPGNEHELVFSDESEVDLPTTPVFSYYDDFCYVFTLPPTRTNCVILGGILHLLFSRASFSSSSLGYRYISVNRCCF